MKLINIRYIKASHEVILYFKDHSIETPATWQTYNLYCDFHKIERIKPELVAVNINTIQWNGTFSELIDF